jgi:hypothetical protein
VPSGELADEFRTVAISTTVGPTFAKVPGELIMTTGGAGQAFVDKFLPMLAHKMDEAGIQTSLMATVEQKVQAIAVDCGVDSSSVLRVAIFDLTSGGAATAPTLAFCESMVTTVAGATGLSIIICSDVPSGKGRTEAKSPMKAEMKAEATDSRSAASMALPAAPSDFKCEVTAVRHGHGLGIGAKPSEGPDPELNMEDKAPPRCVIVITETCFQPWFRAPGRFALCLVLVRGTVGLQ